LYTVFKVDCSKIHPVKIRCEKLGWPNKDEFGKTMYDNVYFQSRYEAWRQLLAEHRAGVYLIWRDIRYTFIGLFHSIGRCIWFLLLLMLSIILYLTSGDWRSRPQGIYRKDC
jgi:hypothetical protein